MSLTAREIEAAVAELAPRLEGARIRDVAGIADDDLVLFAEREGEPRLAVLVSLRDGFVRIHRTTRPRLPGASPAGPATLRLAALVRGAVVRRAECAPSDRVVTLDLDGDAGPRRLRFELFSKRATWVVAGADGRIEAVRAPVRTRLRALEVGAPDAPPTPPGFEPPPSRFPPPGATWEANSAIEAAYAEPSERALVDAVRAALRRRVDARLANRADRERGLRFRIAEAEGAEGLRRRAELLSHERHRIARGAARATVVDYFDPALPTVEIELDPAVDLATQIDRLFSRYHRLVDGLARVRRELQIVEREQEQLRAAAAAVAEAPDLPALEAAREKLESSGALPPPGRSRPKTKPKKERAAEAFRRFTSADGLPILVGKSERQNDDLTFRVARGNDLWLHAGSGAGGSHVVVQCPPESSAPLETLLDAAALAVHFSKLRGAGRAEVIYAPRKRLAKPRGAPPGRVLVAGEKRLLVDLDPPRLDRLLGRDRSEGGA